MNLKPHLTCVERTAVRIGCSVPTVYKIIQRGDLRATRRGSSWSITDADIDAYIASDAEKARREIVAEQRSRERDQRHILKQNQRLAELEASKARDEIHEMLANASVSLIRFIAAVRRAHSVEDDGRRM